ncbi:MAG: transglutaminase family protein [Chloroflexota bacterium]|nr:transglutaminase family protein [Chloroflexota bacterium]
MQIEIAHTIKYSYSKAVFVEPMTLRLRPRCNSAQRLNTFQLNIKPIPAGVSENIDLEGNITATIWFDDEHDFVHVSARSEVETLLTNPFEFIVTEKSALSLPAFYAELYGKDLECYITQRFPCNEVERFIESPLQESRGEIISFLMKLASYIEKSFDKETREHGWPRPPAKTLARRKGTCRDLALLYMEACRVVGIPARFVSGYRCLEDEDSEDRQYLHAWAEVYIPGGGWRGFDPSCGKVVADRHIAVAAAADPDKAAPISGSFRGNNTRSTIEYNVSISPNR